MSRDDENYLNAILPIRHILAGGVKQDYLSKLDFDTDVFDVTVDTANEKLVISVSLDAIEAAMAGRSGSKAPVRFLVTSNAAFTIETGAWDLSGGKTDDVTPAVGDRVGVPFQTDKTENGLWVISASLGDDVYTMARALDFDSSDDAVLGSTFSVLEGTSYEGSEWRMSSPTSGPVELGDTELEFERVDVNRYFPTEGTLEIANITSPDQETVGVPAALAVYLSGGRPVLADVGTYPTQNIAMRSGIAATSTSGEAAKFNFLYGDERLHVEGQYIAAEMGFVGVPGARTPSYWLLHGCANAETAERGGVRVNGLDGLALQSTYAYAQVEAATYFGAYLTSSFRIYATSEGTSINGATETGQAGALRLGNASGAPSSNPTSGLYLWTIDGTSLLSRRPGSTAYCGAGFRSLTSDDDLSLVCLATKKIKMIEGSVNALFVSDEATVATIEGQGAGGTVFGAAAGNATLNCASGSKARITEGGTGVIEFDDQGGVSVASFVATGKLTGASAIIIQPASGQYVAHNSGDGTECMTIVDSGLLRIPARTAASVPTPPSGYSYLFEDSADKKLKTRDDAGTLHATT